MSFVGSLRLPRQPDPLEGKWLRQRVGGESGMTVIDCVKSPPTDAMRAAGVTGVSRYLSLPQDNTVWKRITMTEYDQLRGGGFDVLLNWEYAATDWLGGASAGAAHAADAVVQAKALGYPAGCAIPGSADFNMTHDQWNGPGWQYAKAYSQGVRGGGYRAGVYGPWDVLEWCKSTGWFDMYWQAGMSTSWSGGRNASLWPGAHLRQVRSGFVGGFDVDFNDVLQADYGQYAVDAATTGETVDIGDKYDIARLVLRGLSYELGHPATPYNELETYSLEAVAKQLAAAVAAPVDLDALAVKVAALLKLPTAAEIAKAVNDDAAQRLQS